VSALPVNSLLVVTTRSIATYDLVGDDLALDFANTLEATHAGQPHQDHLRTPADLVTWARRVDALPQPSAPRNLDAALALRAAIHAVFTAVATGDAPPPRQLRTLLAAHATAVAEGRLVPGDPYTWEWKRQDPLWPVAVAAVDLLRDPDRLARVKRCAQCSWLFVDRSRNGSRRWCSMGECGAQVKMRRYRAARRAG
jgi:predicted RNA-binding Zn ribbon-like protein